MNIVKILESVIDMLGDMHDLETDKNYPVEKCLACICQEDLFKIIKYLKRIKKKNKKSIKKYIEILNIIDLP